ncbi:MAG: hypothetical protein ACI8WB_003794 [Phenylobacterium sp.]|jgi:hypothetical protein
MKTRLITTLGLFALSPLAGAIADELAPAPLSQAPAIEKITVEGKRNQANSEINYETEQLLNIAGIDNDPLGAVFSLPGVVYAGGDDGGEPAIRGSSPDDNAFYIDDMPASYIFHLFGDSIFNKNVVRDFALHPAAFNSTYGNATGGVFDVKLRDPRNQDLSITTDISLLKAGVILEGGLSQNQAFYFSYRRSLIHLFLPEGEEDEGYTIFKAPVSDDYQAKYQWLIGDNQKLTFTATGASDVGGINISAASEQGRVDPDAVGDLKVKTQFDNQSLSWQYFGDDQQLFHIALAHNLEKQSEYFGQGQFIHSEEDQTTLRLSYQLEWLDNHQLQVGADLQKNDITYRFDAIPYYCTDHDADCESRKGERTQDSDTLANKDIAIYVNDRWMPNEHFEVAMGLRAERNDYTDQQFVHPRLALSWFTTEQLTLNTKVGSYSRFPDVDTVLRKIGNPNLGSPKATHYSVGLEYDLNEDWQTSVDVYHKVLADLPLSIDEEQDASLLRYTDDLSGTAKGVEWVVRRSLKDGWYGWASLSWSKSDRTNDINKVTTEYYLDTPLLANVVANYKLNDRWDFGLRFTLRSGAKYTPITGLRDNPNHPGHFLANYGDLNSKTLPVYHRLDLQANYHSTLWGYDAQWTFATINTLGRKNISGFYFAPDGNETQTDYNIEGEEGIGLFPSVGLKVTF